jgi:hypothetical protein
MTQPGAGLAAVVNGSLTGPIANGQVPPGWTALQQSPDTMDQFNNVGVSGYLDFGATPSASPDGGTWVGMARDETGFIEEFGQAVSGLSANQAYELSWYGANFGVLSIGYNNPNAIDVLINGVSIGTGPTMQCVPGWTSQSAVFVAATPILTVSFRPAFTDRAYISIDGIAIRAVPEPAAILGAAVLAQILSSRPRRRRLC